MLVATMTKTLTDSDGNSNQSIFFSPRQVRNIAKLNLKLSLE